MFSVLDVSVLTVMYGRGCRALVKFEAQQESKRMGKASGLAGEAFYAGRCKKECLAWISYVADFGNLILNRTWHGKYMKIRKASFSFWGCQNLKHKRQHRQRLKMGKAWIFRQALTIQKRQQTRKNRKNMEDQGRKPSIKTANSTNVKRSCSIHCASKGMTQIGRMWKLKHIAW